MCVFLGASQYWRIQVSILFNVMQKHTDSRKVLIPSSGYSRGCARKFQ